MAKPGLSLRGFHCEPISEALYVRTTCVRGFRKMGNECVARQHALADRVRQRDFKRSELFLEQGDPAKADASIGKDRIQRWHDPSKADSALGSGPRNRVR